MSVELGPKAAELLKQKPVKAFAEAIDLPMHRANMAALGIAISALDKARDRGSLYQAQAAVLWSIEMSRKVSSFLLKCGSLDEFDEGLTNMELTNSLIINGLVGYSDNIFRGENQEKATISCRESNIPGLWLTEEVNSTEAERFRLVGNAHLPITSTETAS